MIEGIKTNQPEVKASKSDKRLQSYGHLKFFLGFVSVYNECRRLLDVAQTPTCKKFDIPLRYAKVCALISTEYLWISGPL